MKETDNSTDLVTDGKLLTLLLKIGCERGEMGSSGSV
jgi:hypothetical protein